VSSYTSNSRTFSRKAGTLLTEFAACAATPFAEADLLAADLPGLDLVALMIDGVHFADHLCIVVLGIGIDGTRHPLGVVEGDTENATVVMDLLAGQRERGLVLESQPRQALLQESDILVGSATRTS
jgi:hypothetical protein